MNQNAKLNAFCSFIYIRFIFNFKKQEEYRTLSLVSRDYHPMNVLNIEYVVDSTNLGFMASDMEENFVIFMYQPESRDSYGGQKLLRKADYHLGQRVSTMFRIQCNYTRILNANYDNKHTTYFGWFILQCHSVSLFNWFQSIQFY